MGTINHTNCAVCGSSNISEIFKLKDHSHTGKTFPVAVCGDCGFHFTQDVPDAESIGPYYKSENYDTSKPFYDWFSN